MGFLKLCSNDRIVHETSDDLFLPYSLHLNTHTLVGRFIIFRRIKALYKSEMKLKSVFPPTIHLTKDGFLLDSNKNGDGEITYVSY